MFRSTPHTSNVALTPQLTTKAKTLTGMESCSEMIIIFHIVTDEDGGLKIKDLEEFIDSKAYLDFFQAVVAAKANK